MRSLITGGAGFIGSHLAGRLLELGHHVTVLDDLSTGSMANIARFKRSPEFEYYIDSIFNRRLLAELIDDCDVAFHLAAAVGVRLIVESPVRTLDINVRGTETVLEVAAKKKKKVVITSTSEVYGKASKIPFHEDDDLVLGPTVRNRWSYACSKAVDEFLALGYHAEKELPVVIARLFNTVGPGQSPAYGMVLPRFVAQALSDEPITVYGNGEQSRCFSWVGDVVNALAELAIRPSVVGRVFNIGSEEEVTIGELARRVVCRVGSMSPIVRVPYEKVYGIGFEDMMRRVPDLTRIRQAIGYNPTKTLDEVIDAVAASVRAGHQGDRRVVAPVDEVVIAPAKASTLSLAD